jgi:1-acyl-sn-glycerol-3-phosphate acyltransferase
MARRTSADKSALARGAERASGERARRRSTPLLPSDPGPDAVPRATAPPGSARTSSPNDAVDGSSGTSPTGDDTGTKRRRAHRPKPVARPIASRRATARSGNRRTERPTRRSDPAPAAATPESDPKPKLSVVTDETSSPTSSATSVTPGLAEMLEVAISTVRAVGQSMGLSSEEIDQRIAEVLHLLRRRLTGDYEVDDFGFDRDFTDNVYLPLIRPLYRSWFRVEVRGIENIPPEGGVLIVANHSGTIAMDALMTQVAVHDEHPAHRYLRMLGADFVFQSPVIGDFARKTGATLATNADAERLLTSGEVVGVWPEGFKGVGKPFRERYKLQRFGRGGFVSAALRTSAPIVPCSIVGAEEIYPMIGNLRTIARLVGAPYVPVTPTFPWLGPLGLIPLPSKWIIEFGAPVETSPLGSAAADDPMLVFDLTDQIRETIQQTLYSLLMGRRSVFF